MRPCPVCRLLVLLVLMTSVPRAVRAQSRSSTSAPAAVVDSFFHAVDQAQWRDAARLMDLETLGTMRDREVREIRRPRRPARPMTPEELMKADPKMPRVVAEYQVSRVNDQSDRFDFLAYEYANVPSVDSLAALSVDEAAARWIEANDPRYRMRRALTDPRRSCALPDSVVTQLLPSVEHRILGSVLDDSIAYVLYHETVAMPHESTRDSASKGGRAKREARAFRYIEPPPVMVLRRMGNGWRIFPSIPFERNGVMAADCSAVGPEKPQSP